MVLRSTAMFLHGVTPGSHACKEGTTKAKIEQEKMANDAAESTCMGQCTKENTLEPCKEPLKLELAIDAKEVLGDAAGEAVGEGLPCTAWP